MSGDLFAVYGKIQYSPVEQCPEELKGTILRLKSKDEEIFEVEAEAGCMSQHVKNVASMAGPEEEISLPMKKATLGKVVEYMKYHVSNPCGALRTPLESENLVECGVTKWDNSFVSLDKDSVMDLVLAAALLQLPSLFFLTGAKLAVMTKDKPPEKLLKDFALALDMGAEEEQQLKQKVQEAQRTSWGQGYDDSLTAVACITTALSQAAERSGAGLEGSGSGSGSGGKSYRLASWRAAALQDWHLLAEAPEELRAERPLVLALLKPSSGAALALASAELRADRELVLEAVRQNAAALEQASDALRGDRAFLLQALRLGGGAALGGALEELRGSRDFLLQAAQAGLGSALQGASQQLRADRMLVLEAVSADAEALKHADDELRHDKDFVLQAVRRNGGALQHVPHQLKCDKDVVQMAIGSDSGAGVHAHSSRRLEMGADMPWDSEAWQQEEVARQVKAGVKGGSRFVPCPYLPDISPEDEVFTRKIRVQKFVLFSGMGTITPNIGQVNYLAANSLHDRMPCYSRPEVDTVTLLQGAVGGTVGMRWKAFASADQLANASPESMLQITDECKILDVLCTRMDPPEAVAGAFLDELSRQYMLAPSAGVIQAPPWGANESAWRASAAAAAPAAKSRAEPEREQGQPDGKSRESSTLEPGPLGGWPSLAAASLPLEQRRGVGAQAVQEGSRVRLTGLAAHNKLNLQVGTALRQFKDGKWKVQLDKGLGHVLVTNDRLQVLFDEVALLGPLADAKVKAPEEESTAEDNVDDDEPPALENQESDEELSGIAAGATRDIADARLTAGAAF